MTYSIVSINDLETSTANLANYNQQLANDTHSLSYIITEIKNNWQNEAGADLASVIKELETCVTELKEAVEPTLSKYVTTMNTLVAESRSHQSKTIQQ